MTNEMKLLLAFIEASGYEVEEEAGSPAFIGSYMGVDQFNQTVKGYKVTKKKAPESFEVKCKQVVVKGRLDAIKILLDEGCISNGEYLSRLKDIVNENF